MTAVFELDPELTREQIKNAEDQGQALIGLYRVAFPDWDTIKSIDGWPKVNTKTWRHICLAFQKLDQEKHPDVLPGGLWMNKGFSTDDSLADWVVLVDCEVEYQ